MADRSDFLFLNANSENENSTQADSLLYTSYKTASAELTDSLLSKLSTDTIYRDGSVAFTANQPMGNNRITNMSAGIDPNDAVTRQQLENAIEGLQDFRQSVIDGDLLDPPPAPNDGDRYLIGKTNADVGNATGAWTGQEKRITEWDQTGGQWTFEDDPDNGTTVFIEDENARYVFNNDDFATGEWVLFNSGQVTYDDGLILIGSSVNVDNSPNGGLKFIAAQLAVEPDDFAGQGLQDDGSDNLEIDFAAWPGEEGTQQAVASSTLTDTSSASFLGANPANVTQTNATTVQGQLDDISTAIDDLQPGIDYTFTDIAAAGTLVYVSGNNIVTTYPLSGVTLKPIGVTSTTTVGTNQLVKVVQTNQTVNGTLTAATAGAEQFWQGNTWGQVAPSAAGEAIVSGGVAKNTTDLQVNTQFVRRNG